MKLLAGAGFSSTGAASSAGAGAEIASAVGVAGDVVVEVAADVVVFAEELVVLVEEEDEVVAFLLSVDVPQAVRASSEMTAKEQRDVREFMGAKSFLEAAA